MKITHNKLIQNNSWVFLSTLKEDLCVEWWIYSLIIKQKKNIFLKIQKYNPPDYNLILPSLQFINNWHLIITVYRLAYLLVFWWISWLFIAHKIWKNCQLDNQTRCHPTWKYFPLLWRFFFLKFITKLFSFIEKLNNFYREKIFLFSFCLFISYFI